MKECNRMNKHSDCKHFVAIDVVKGICRVKNETILIDGDVCPKFEAVQKCKNCENFTSSKKDTLGTCEFSKAGYWTFEDNFAQYCEGYETK